MTTTSNLSALSEIELIPVRASCSAGVATILDVHPNPTGLWLGVYSGEPEVPLRAVLLTDRRVLAWFHIGDHVSHRGPHLGVEPALAGEVVVEQLSQLKEYPSLEEARSKHGNTEWKIGPLFDVSTGAIVERIRCPSCLRDRAGHGGEAFEMPYACCNKACEGHWGTGCYHCHHPSYISRGLEIIPEGTNAFLIRFADGASLSIANVRRVDQERNGDSVSITDLVGSELRFSVQVLRSWAHDQENLTHHKGSYFLGTPTVTKTEQPDTGEGIQFFDKVAFAHGRTGGKDEGPPEGWTRDGGRGLAGPRQHDGEALDFIEISEDGSEITVTQGDDSASAPIDALRWLLDRGPLPEQSDTGGDDDDAKPDPAWEQPMRCGHRVSSVRVVFPPRRDVESAEAQDEEAAMRDAVPKACEMIVSAGSGRGHADKVCGKVAVAAQQDVPVCAACLIAILREDPDLASEIRPLDLGAVFETFEEMKDERRSRRISQEVLAMEDLMDKMDYAQLRSFILIVQRAVLSAVDDLDRVRPRAHMGDIVEKHLQRGNIIKDGDW